MSEYEVLAIRYAHNAERRAAENFIGGDPHDGPMPMDYFVWALRDGGRTIVIDTGFDAAMASKRDRKLTRPVAEGLKAAGIDPASVGDVVLTHLHYDHAGNHDAFPGARYHVQDREMEYCTGRCMCHSTLRHPFELDDVTAMMGKLFQGRVTFHNGARSPMA
jgi:glyoxylase-like metal-dependent hydrolase (beta-lactamase superfamily II)